MQILNSFPVQPRTQSTPSQVSEDAKTAQQQILSSLGPHLSDAELDGMLSAKMSDYTPEKVAARVTDFVAAGLAAAAQRGASPERLEELYQSAVKGVEKGFAEAKTILEAMPLYTAEIRNMVADTEKLTFENLAKINPAAQSVDPVELLNAQAELRESMTIKLMTRDGDQIQVRFSNSESGAFSQTGDGWQVGYQSSSSYQFKVNGELDAEEIDAITSLLDQVSGVADEFYSGRVDQAFELAQELQMDTGELARFDLNLQMSSRVEVRQYQEMSESARPERAIAGKIQNWLDSAQTLREHPGLESLEQPAQSLRELLVGALDVRGNKPGVPPGLERLLGERLAD